MGTFQPVAVSTERAEVFGSVRPKLRAWDNMIDLEITRRLTDRIIAAPSVSFYNSQAEDVVLGWWQLEAPHDLESANTRESDGRIGGRILRIRICIEYPRGL